MMHPPVTIFALLCLAFLAVVGFCWMRNGSLERAGADVGPRVDAVVEKIDWTTKTLQKESGKRGEATKETVHNARDGDDRT
jgi:hypothetical protein